MNIVHVHQCSSIVVCLFCPFIFRLHFYPLCGFFFRNNTVAWWSFNFPTVYNSTVQQHEVHNNMNFKFTTTWDEWNVHKPIRRFSARKMSVADSSYWQLRRSTELLLLYGCHSYKYCSRIQHQPDQWCLEENQYDHCFWTRVTGTSRFYATRALAYHVVVG